MAEELQKAHLFYDDINKIRVLETSVLKETEDLNSTCKEYESSKIIRSMYCGYIAVAKLLIKYLPSILAKLDIWVYLIITFLSLTEVQDFGKIINSLLEVLKELGDNVEKQKMAAIGSMNLLKSITKERESEQAKLQVSQSFRQM